MPAFFVFKIFMVAAMVAGAKKPPNRMQPLNIGFAFMVFLSASEGVREGSDVSAAVENAFDNRIATPEPIEPPMPAITKVEAESSPGKNGVAEALAMATATPPKRQARLEEL